MKNTMKRLHTYLMLIACSFSLFVVACSSDDDPATQPTDLKISENILNNGMTFAKSGGTQTLNVQSPTEPQVTSNQPEWCTVSKEVSQSKTIYKYSVTTQPNGTTEDRTATIRIEAGAQSESFEVTQTAADGLIVESEKNPSASADGEELTVRLKTNGNVSVSIETAATSWIKQVIETRAAMEEKSLRFRIEPNYGAERTGIISFTLGELSESISVTQAAGTRTDIGMESDAQTLAAKIKIGWNLGNSLEAISDGKGSETAWGNPKTTKTLIDAVKAAGFNAVRIPCAWDPYIEDRTTHQIQASWLARVAEVVDYCVANDMYVIINTHWDGGWLENNPTYAKQEEVNEKLAAIWKQIATHFADYDEHLLFAGTNEVHVENVYTDPTTENNTVQQSFNQTFVDAVRSTGGKNSLRNLIVQTYNTNIDWGVRFLTMPTDEAENRLMVEVHYYDPYNFVLDENDSTCKLYWGEPYKQYGSVDSWGQEDYLDSAFRSAKTAFGDKGYPVIIGEYGVVRRSSLTGDELTHHLESRAYFLKCVTATAKKYGLVPFYWDNGYEGDKTMALFRRATGEVYDAQALQALMEGAEETE